ncbi:hypothetical protein ACH5RR_021381 [Cinchona calisaya]|uniref:GHMP kinase N-terminal domain-containing protein n=1 Tax=Cinchona calisaya TaxID=153742 RepID=A0ABD2ZKY7_9GENT
MASSQFLCSHQLHTSCRNGKPQLNSFNKGSIFLSPTYRPKGSSPFLGKKSHLGRTLFVKAASDSRTGRKQMYDLEDKLNKLADEVDENSGLTRLTLFSPCKINVFPRITGKREDVYHDLAYLSHVISLGDKIKFSLAHQNQMIVYRPMLQEFPLIIEIWYSRKLLPSIQMSFGLILVPTGAGLGGGSSIAATALWAANQFSGCIASEKDLQEWSSEIGSDIPFFFSNGAAYCTGRGEVVQDIRSPIGRDIPMVLIKTPEACSTAEVYKRLRLDETQKIDPLTLLEKISMKGICQDTCVNDLEPCAFEVLPSLKRLKQRVTAAGQGQYDAVFVSGSTIVGVGSPDPPQFVYDDDEYKDVFLSEAHFITRPANQWYSEPELRNAGKSATEFLQTAK